MNKSSIPILSIAYLPPISYFVLLYKADKALIEQHETYSKQTYRNRCEIYTEKGKTSLTIPVNKPHGNRSKTSEVKIFNEDKWYIKHWRTIEIAYSASPYFLYYSDDLKSFFNGVHDSLLLFDMALLKHLCEVLEINTSIELTNEYTVYHDTNPDYREILTPKKSSVIERPLEYTQVFNNKHGFISNLCILDLLFNLGPESTAYISNSSLVDYQLNRPGSYK